MTKKIVSTLMVLAIAAVMSGEAWGQGQTEWSQATACPGWNNPANFTSAGTPPNSNQYYQGAVGMKNSAPLSGTCGMNFENYTCNPIAPSQMTSVTGTSPVSLLSSYYSTNCGSIPNSQNMFSIQSGSGNDPNTGNQLPYVPTQFNSGAGTPPGVVRTELTKSIRIGDGCAGGAASALYYTMKVTPQNAMLFIYYACVIEAPGHGTDQDPVFIIRVTKQQGNNWVPISDTLTYMVSSTPASNGGSVVIGQNGWHQQGSGYGAVFWKEWDKVAINLNNYLYSKVRIEVMIGDCSPHGHYGYAYIAGECRQMSLKSSGCPAGMATDVTTLTAPNDMRNYVWYASEWGQYDPPTGFGPGEENAHVTWRQLTESTSLNNQYNVQADDFRVTRAFGPTGMPTTIDSVGNRQTFRCQLTSALNPALPFNSYLYVNVQNTKPSMMVDSMLLCDGTMKVWNESAVPGDPSLVVRNQTTWKVFNNPSCTGTPASTFTGDSVTYHFDDTEMKGLLVRTVTDDTSCYSEAIYPIRPRTRPNAGMILSREVLCDADEVTITDTTSGTENYDRIWFFRGANAADDDMSFSDSIVGHGATNRSLSRSFTHALEPIRLLVGNRTYMIDTMAGPYYIDPVNGGDTLWCSADAYDTVSVFLHPELVVEGDTVVCEGSTTNATVTAPGVAGCTYEWSTSLNTITGNIPAGQTLQVVPYADKATYYVRVTSPQGCVAWDSIHAYLVRPKLSIIPSDGRICPGQTAVLTGSDADHYTWTASPDDSSMAGQESADNISVSPSETTTYTMVGHGSNGCDATPLQKTVTIVPLPIGNVSVSPGFVDSEDPKVTLRDISTYGASSSWLFSDGSSASGREVAHSFDECIGLDSVHATLTSYNELGCPTVYPFSIPVNIYTAWFPTAFTPGSNDGNAYFSLYSVNEYEFFHIYIYNRRGEMVYESSDSQFQWDGTCKGDPCQQGAYVYICRYRKPGSTNLAQLQGTVTLIR